MITDNEKTHIKMLRDVFLASAGEMILSFGVEPTDELKAQFVGANMATMDALFAIREGEPWRGITDPKKIATEVLRIAIPE